ncbi:hypothetical protein [Glaciimonas immobilis]|uniref:Uncharacterized protein n=1 Tax=Glaciimonas immobilis TaxID=728004 RepID=A0A840RQS1_9BURK|nr:hypothetical protein [Glaciimonas immobilis]KAF3997987.1 hypothetical protein HAV38_10510 [Glaciimonas immobilis]MBB5199336.1 hypothetical protein [Glaciimonas immobilis]
MFDGLWHGIFGGLFGPGIAQWMNRFKYWVIFLTGMAGTYIGLYVAGIYTKGLKIATQIMLKNIIAPDLILVSVGIGLLMLFVAFVGVLGTSKKSSEDDKNDS